MLPAVSQYAFPPDTTTGKAAVPLALRGNIDQWSGSIGRKETSHDRTYFLVNIPKHQRDFSQVLGDGLEIGQPPLDIRRSVPATWIKVSP